MPYMVKKKPSKSYFKFFGIKKRDSIFIVSLFSIFNIFYFATDCVENLNPLPAIL